MLPCKNCAYKKQIPGDCHISCAFDWGNADEETRKGYPRNQGSAHTAQWFRFPLNYDPVWGPDKCPARAAKSDPKMVAKRDPLAELFSLLR